MSNSKTINSLKDALRAFWLEDRKDANLRLSEHEVQLILSADEPSFDMNESRRKELIDKLYNTIQGASLGALIKEKLSTKKIKEAVLTEKTKIPAELITELKEDKVYPNYIPVIWMQSLLDLLDISIQTARSAIMKTYEMIKLNSTPVKPVQEVRLVYRKPNGKKKKNGTRWNSTDARQQFETRASIDKYLDLLEKHMRSNS